MNQLAWRDPRFSHACFGILVAAIQRTGTLVKSDSTEFARLQRAILDRARGDG
jgi:hypothetical protein